MNFNKLFTIAFLSIFFTSSLFSQTTLSGTLLEQGSEHPLPFAHVTLLSPVDSSLVTGAITDESGNFNIEAEPGNYIFRAGFVGYSNQYRNISLASGRNALGNIYISPASETLDEVLIEATAPIFRSDFDRRIFDVENTIVAEGGTALDLLETLPSIQVDEEGNISMRGSGNILIYINGRPTNIITDDAESVLEQYPANSIKSIEIITNPSARYDAEGIGGIINIILKEESRGGMNGQLTISAGTGHKYSGGILVNYNTGKFNFFTNYTFNYRENWQRSQTWRQNFTGLSSPFLDHDFDTRNYGRTHVIRPGFEWNIDSSNNLQVSANINQRGSNNARTYFIRSLDENHVLDSMYIRQLNEEQSRMNLEANLGYNRNFRKKGQRLSTGMSYAISDQDRIEYFDEQFINHLREEVPEARGLQTYERPVSNSQWLLQADYEHPLGENSRIDAGWKSSLSNDKREQSFNEYNFEMEEFVTNELISGDFEYGEHIHAAYLISRNKYGKFSYQAGLRGELTLTNSYLPVNDQGHQNNYFNLFPSMFLNYDIARDHQLQLNYSRRIRRPGMYALTPLINAQDLLNLRIGNPFLEPEYTGNYEFSYLRGWKKYFITGSLYYRYTTNALTRVYYLFDEHSTIVTWVNASERSNTGLELINRFTLGRNFDATLSGNFFHSNISGSTNGEDYSNESFSWTLSLLGNLRLARLASIQVMGNYRGPMVIPQGRIEPMMGLNIGMRRNILKQQGTLALNVSDVFNTRQFTIQTQTGDFYQQRNFKRESRVLSLAVTYRFKGYSGRDQQRAPGNGDDMEDEVF